MQIGNGGFVASPGDIVVWAGLVVLVVEVVGGVTSRVRPVGDARLSGAATGGGQRRHSCRDAPPRHQNLSAATARASYAQALDVPMVGPRL